MIKIFALNFQVKAFFSLKMFSLPVVPNIKFHEDTIFNLSIKYLNKSSQT